MSGLRSWTGRGLPRRGPAADAVATVCWRQDFIFVTEQRGMTIMIFNKTTSSFIKHINAAIFENTSAIPYDVTMYDNTVQQRVDCESAQLSDSLQLRSSTRYLFYSYLSCT